MIMRGLCVALFGVLLVPPLAGAADEDKLNLDKIPGKVMDTLKAKFPKAKIHKWTKEKEDGAVIYDIEFKQGKQKFEADIKEDGTIHNWEKQITVKGLPAAVKKAVDKKYPGATLTEIMEISEVKKGKDVLAEYEVVLKTADKKDLEITLTPAGKIVEVSAAD